MVPIPVSDVDRAKAFYDDKVGVNVDLDVNADNDHRVSDEVRDVQLTPPGSACSIAFGVGIVDTPPGSVQARHLVVPDINAARAELLERGDEVGEVQDRGGVLYAAFSDPPATAGPCSSSLIRQARRPPIKRTVAGMTCGPIAKRKETK